MCAIIRRRNFSKNSDVDFSIGCAIVGSRNMFYPNCSNTSHTRKGINFSIQNFLFLMFVNHLLFRKQKRRIFLEGEATFSLSQGDEATSSPRFNSPHLQQRFPQHNQQQLQHNHPRGHEDFRPPSSEHFNWRFEFFSSSYLTFHIKNMAEKC